MDVQAAMEPKCARVWGPAAQDTRLQHTRCAPMALPPAIKHSAGLRRPHAHRTWNRAPDSRPPDRPFFSTPSAKPIWVEVGPAGGSGVWGK